MKAVILSAGRGTRLGNLTEETPKCLLQIKSKPIIDYSIDNLKSCGFKSNDIGIVVGFQKEKIIHHLGNEYTYIINDDFSETNDMASFYLSREFVNGGDCLFLHSDVFYDVNIIKDCLLADKDKSFLVVDTKKWTEESMKVSAKDGCMVRAGKDLPDGETCGDWIGIAKFDKYIINNVFNTIKNLLDRGEHKNWMATGCFNEMARKNHKLHILPAKDYEWIEIDFEKELRYANDALYDKLFII